MSRYLPITPELFIRNRKKLYNGIKEQATIIIFSSPQRNRNGDQYYSYKQNSNFFYLCGIEEPHCILVMCPNHNSQEFKETLFIQKIDEKTRIWHGDSISESKAREISGIKNIKLIEEFYSHIDKLFLSSNQFFISYSENIKTDSAIDFQGSYEQKNFLKKYSYINFQDIDNDLNKLRTIKEPEEIELIIKACKITSESFINLCKIVKPNKYEYEIEANITHTFISNGASGHAYPPIVASGANACVLHYNNNNCKIQDGDLLLLDFGAEYANYAADCSRTIPINGKFTARQLELYNAVLNVFFKLKNEFKHGNTINALNITAGLLIQEELLRLGLLTKNDIQNQNDENPAYKKYFPHGISHFMGLDVHDVGDKNAIFTSGMVLTCEPGLYLPQENIGIRIENDILISENGAIDLMSDIPIYPNDIEDLMQQE